MKAVIKQQGGKYKGTGFCFDAKEAQGLCSHTHAADAENEDGEEEEVPQQRTTHPIKKLGLGISVWLELLENLCVFFFMIAIIGFVMCKLLASQGEITDVDDGFARIADFSLGNLQGAQSSCYN